jgi:hypothetical protein
MALKSQISLSLLAGDQVKVVQYYCVKVKSLELISLLT